MSETSPNPSKQDSETWSKTIPWVIGFGTSFVVLLLLISIMTTERGMLINATPKTLGGNFSLMGKNGRVSLTDFKDKVVLMYFGFLHCPEVCPQSMAIYQQTLNTLTDEELKQVQPLLVTIDPERDTVDELHVFADYYHDKIKGLTGTVEEIREVANQYGAYFKAVPDEGKAEYVFEHTSRYYVIDQHGQLVDAMRHSTTANELGARIRTLL